MKIRRYIILLVLSFTGTVLTAQVSQSQYFIGFPQANLANPAFRPSSKVYVGLPVLSNTYLSISNNMFNLEEMFQPIPGTDSTMTILHPDFDRDAFLDKMGKTGYLSVDASTQILGFGFTIDNDWWIDLSLSQKASASAYVPRDLFTVLFEGNEQFVGSSIDLSGFGFEVMQYMESSIGISKNITEKLRVGGRAKLLFGGAGAAIDNERLEIEVNQDFSHTLHSDLSLNVSGPVTFYTNVDNMIDSVMFFEDINPFDILINSANTGMAFDIGAEYRLLPNLSVSASLIDLGFIGWKSDVFNLKATNDFSFDGFDVSGVIEGDLDFDTMLENFKDSLLNSFELSDGADRFSIGLPAKLFIGGQYRPLDMIGLGVLSRTTFNEGHVSQALSLSGTLYAGDIFSASLTYSIANRSYNNFGFGMAARLGPVQIYTVADQLPASWVRFEENGGNGFAVPNRLDYFNFRFGMNLVFGKLKQKAVDKPMLLE